MWRMENNYSLNKIVASKMIHWEPLNLATKTITEIPKKVTILVPAQKFNLLWAITFVACRQRGSYTPYQHYGQGDKDAKKSSIKNDRESQEDAICIFSRKFMHATQPYNNTFDFAAVASVVNSQGRCVGQGSSSRKCYIIHRGCQN